MLNEVRIGEVYYHYKNRKPYKVVDLNVMIQKNGKWYPAVIYEPLDSEKRPVKIKYVREMKEFMKKFSEK